MFGLRAYPTPVRLGALVTMTTTDMTLQIVRPLWPFMVSGLVVFFGVAKAQSAMLQSMADHLFFSLVR